MGRSGLLLGVVCACAVASHVEAVEVRAPELRAGDRWTVAAIEPVRLPSGQITLDSATLWDLRPLLPARDDASATPARLVRRTVVDPRRGELSELAARLDADLALCSVPQDSNQLSDCSLFRSSEIRATGPRPLVAGGTIQPAGAAPADTVAIGAEWIELASDPDGATVRVFGKAVAEGVLLVPAGPREVVLVREELHGDDAPILRYRFLTAQGRLAALLEGPLPAEGSAFAPVRAELLVSEDQLMVSDGMSISYAKLSPALDPGKVGLVQRSISARVPLSSANPSWPTVAAMISIDATAVGYQPDPGDPGSLQGLPEVWDFSGLSSATLAERVFETTRDDSYTGSCFDQAASCSVKNQTGSPPDGTWQSYLKIDRYDTLGAFATRDIYALNDNDTGANPSIDVPYIAQDELNTADRVQICFDDSAGGAERLLKFFKFTGANPATAVMDVGDTWETGAWTQCSTADGLRLTLASACGDQCYPGCGSVAPFARGMINPTVGIGLRSTILEDGWVHMPTGNYVPALLMRQDTDLEAGRNFGGTCTLGKTRNRAYDYFWIQEHYGLLAHVSSPNDVSPFTMPPDDWTAVNHDTDGVDVTWGPYPPHQTSLQACLSGTRVQWSLPVDGSNLGADLPAVGDYGYVVSWGTSSNAEALADWSTNPNHTPLPAEVGYLAAPPGNEPTSTVITGWPGAAIDVTVVTALRYTDPDFADQRTFRSAAFYKVHENPARLDPVAFRVGPAVVPFATRSGDDIDLSWPAVAGAAGYLLKVWDLDTDTEIPCPPALDCNPAAPSATHVGAAIDGNSYGYRAFAVDPCGEASAD